MPLGRAQVVAIYEQRLRGSASVSCATPSSRLLAGKYGVSFAPAHWKTGAFLWLSIATEHFCGCPQKILV